MLDCENRQALTSKATDENSNNLGGAWDWWHQWAAWKFGGVSVGVVAIKGRARERLTLGGGPWPCEDVPSSETLVTFWPS
jgi:hypothetical protein